MMKNILVIYKKSVYKHSFLDENGILKRHYSKLPTLKRFKDAHAQHYKTIKQVERALHQHNIPYEKKSRGQRIDPRRFDLIITIGGDGTFLEAARSIKGELILGVNSDPQYSVGRFCAATGKTFSEILDQIIKKEFRVTELNRIRLKMKGISPGINILNDVLLCNKNPAAMSHYFLTVNGVTEEQRSSGVWIATAAGSTGAIRSAGGKVLPLTSKKLQYRVRELYYGKNTAHRLKGGVVSERQAIKLISNMKDGEVYVDGSHLKLRFAFGEHIALSKSSERLRVIQ